MSYKKRWSTIEARIVSRCEKRGFNETELSAMKEYWHWIIFLDRSLCGVAEEKKKKEEICLKYNIDPQRFDQLGNPCYRNLSEFSSPVIP